MRDRLTTPGLAVELRLLERMSLSYRTITLREIGLSEEQAARIREGTTFKVPGSIGSHIRRYLELLGPAHRREALVRTPSAYPGSTEHSFLLVLWPHLYWTVNSRPDGETLGAGFQNQVDLQYQRFDPALVRVGLWTRGALERLADSHKLHDGWDEQVIVHFEFGARRFAGEFVLDLLQDWCEL